MVFGLSIYRDRVRRATEVAASRGLAGLILTRPSSIFYVAGFVHMPTPERPLCAVLPADGDPFLLTPAVEYGHAKSKSWFNDVRQWYFDLPSGEQPFKSLAKMLGEAKMVGKSIGLEDTSVIDALRKEMPGTTLLNAKDIIWRLRMIKSNEEIELMREHAAYADFALGAVKDSIQEGITELEIVGKAVQKTLFKMSKEVQNMDGPMPVNVRVVAGARTAFPHAFSGTSKSKRGDEILAVVITTAYGYECGEIARTFFFGEPSEEKMRLYVAASKGMALVMKAMRPGVKCSELHRINCEHLARSGYAGHYPVKTGTMRGLESRDGVYLSELDQTVLEPGMTFFVGSGICIPGKGGYRLGEMVLVTETGAESLHKFPSNIQSVTIRA